MTTRFRSINSTLHSVLEVAKEVATLNDIARTVVGLVDKARQVSLQSITLLIIAVHHLPVNSRQANQI